MTAAELQLGDVLCLPDRDVIITRLVPATAEETRAYGTRQVFSGTWSQTYDADEQVEALRDVVTPADWEVA